jgi:type I restriction enzyme S subunit
VDARFLQYCFDSTPFASFVDLIPAGTAQRVLNLGDLSNFVVALPAIEEQRTIVMHIAAGTRAVSALLGKIQEAIDRLKELRTTLISAAVTGKIDVREATLGIPGAT